MLTVISLIQIVRLELSTASCRGCAFCFPGLFGMKKVTAELGGRAVGVMVPPHAKDMRELLTGGLIWSELLEKI